MQRCVHCPFQSLWSVGCIQWNRLYTVKIIVPYVILRSGIVLLYYSCIIQVSRGLVVRLM